MAFEGQAIIARILTGPYVAITFMSYAVAQLIIPSSNLRLPKFLTCGTDHITGENEWPKGLSVDAKIQLLKTCVFEVLLYAAEAYEPRRKITSVDCWRLACGATDEH